MGWPRPDFVLYVLGAFLVGYGVALAIRAGRARRWRGQRASCPDCNRPWPKSEPRAPSPGEANEAQPASRRAAACASCGSRPPAPSAIRRSGLWIIAGVLVSVAGTGVFLTGVVLADWLDRELNIYAPGRGRGLFGPVLGAGFGLSLFGLYVAILGYRGQRSRGRRRCPKCWYLIDEALGLNCSECGYESRREADLFRPRRRWRIATLGLLLVAAGQLGWLESRVRRGGWIAAVPSEVLIVGMPWLPDSWLRTGAPGAVEDWSLVGRVGGGSRYSVAGGEAWTDSWARRRAAGWVRDARSTDVALHRLKLLTSLDGGRAAAGGSSELLVGALHCLRLGLEHLASPDDLWAGDLVRTAADRLWLLDSSGSSAARPAPEAARLADESTDRLLEILRSGPGSSTNGAVIVLAMGDGRPEVIDALLVLAPRERFASITLGWLAARYTHVADALAEILTDPADPRRLAAATATRWGMRPPHARRLESALLEAARGGDADVALAAVEALALQGSPESHGAAFEALLNVARKDPATVDRCMRVAFYFSDVVNSRESLMLELSREDDPELQRLFVGIVFGSRPDSGALRREAARLAGSGVPAPSGGNEFEIERMRGWAESENP